MTPEYFAAVKPTYIENWSRELHRLSLRQVDIPLTLHEAETLSRRARGAPRGWSSAIVHEGLERVAWALAEALRQMPTGAFVRLGSRSAKDSRYALHRGHRVDSVHGALAMLTSGSERMAFDLRLALNHNYPPHLFVREWVDIPVWAELRCFMQRRRLVGISQYDCLNLGHSPELHEHACSLQAAIHAFFEQFQAACHLDDVVFDVIASPASQSSGEPLSIRLLELNPFLPQTDSCLFTWAAGGDFDGSFRML